MANIRLDRKLANETTLLLTGQVESAPGCRILRAEIRPPAPDNTVMSFAEAPAGADGSFRLMLPLQAAPAALAGYCPCQGPFRIAIHCVDDPNGPRYPDASKPQDAFPIDCQPKISLGVPDVAAVCVGGDGIPLRVVKLPLTVLREAWLGDIAVGVEILTGAVVRERQILICRGEGSQYALAAEFQVPGGVPVTLRAGLVGTTADAPLLQVVTGPTINLAPCEQPPPSPPPPPPGDPKQEPAPAWCARLPFSCLQLLVLWRSLLLAGLAATYIGLVLAPPDWGFRVFGYLVGKDIAGAVAGVQQIAASTVGGGAGSGTAGAAAGGTAGTVVPVIGNIIGAAGGGGAGGIVGGGSSGAGATAGTLLTDTQRRTLDAFIAIGDGFVVLGGWTLLAIGVWCGGLGLLALLLWWLCCGRGNRCAFWTQITWVLEATMVFVMPVTGTVATFATAALSLVGGAAAAGRVSTGFFLQLFGGTVISLVLYGFARWRRDQNGCPVRPLWRWPWEE